MTELSVYRGDITTFAVDAVVNAAKSSLLGGGGVDGAIHAAGGDSILEACRTIVGRDGPCPPGKAVATTAGELEAGMVIHTVGPAYSHEEAAQHALTLGSCYTSALDLARQHHAKTVAFPNISTGVYRYPKLQAALVALNATIDWLEASETNSFTEISFVCFDDENYEIYCSILD